MKTPGQKLDFPRQHRQFKANSRFSRMSMNLAGASVSEGRFSTITRHQTISLKWVRKPTKRRSKPNQAAASLLETPWWPGIHISHLIHSDVPSPPNTTIFQINFDSQMQSQRAITAASLSKSERVYIFC